MKTYKKTIEPFKLKEILTCYVCGKLIRDNPGVYIGGDKFRHIRCVPGGAKWMGSEQAKHSELTQYFESEARP